MLVTWLNHGIKYIDCDRRNLMWPFLTAITTLTVLDDSPNWSPGRNQQLLCLQVWLSAGGTLHSSTIFSNELGSAIGQIPSRKRRRQLWEKLAYSHQAPKRPPSSVRATLSKNHPCLCLRTKNRSRKTHVFEYRDCGVGCGGVGGAC